MENKNIGRYFIFSVYVLLGIFVVGTTVFVATNVKLSWFPEYYSSFVDETRNDALSTVFWLMILILFMSSTRNFFKSNASTTTADQLAIEYFYKIGPDIKEEDGNVIASLEVYGNINGNGGHAKVLATIKKENFPFFVLKEKREDRKIFPGSFFRVNY